MESTGVFTDKDKAAAHLKVCFLCYFCFCLLMPLCISKLNALKKIDYSDEALFIYFFTIVIIFNFVVLE